LGCLPQLFRRLGILVLFFVIFIFFGMIYFYVTRSNPPAVLLTPTAGGPVPTLSPNVIDSPKNFETKPEYVVSPGTEVKGLGVVDKGFTFLGTERIELVTGYLINLPSSVELAGFKLELVKPNTVLELLLLGFKAIGVNDRQNLPGMQPVGEESVGVTFWTTWNESKLRVDAIVFRKNNTGAVAAVVYAEGQKSSVTVNQIAKALETKIPPGK
jgi:hypothetical protein